MIIRDFIQKVYEDHADSEAVVSGGRRLDYRELYVRCRKIAYYLQNRGIGKGDVVSILHQNSHYFLEAYFACAFSGIILNSINTRLSPNEINYILRHSGSKLLITNRSFAEKTEEVNLSGEKVIWTDAAPGNPRGINYEDIITDINSEEALSLDLPEIYEDDPAHLYYTSGTTGRPKGVVLTNKNVTVHSLAAIEEFEIDENDRWLHAAPMFHLADAWACFAFTLVGAKHVILEEFTPEEVFRLVEEEKVTISNMIPTMLNFLINSESIDSYDLSSLRVILSGGAPIAPELVRQIIEKFGCDYVQTYGMTETSPYLTISILKEHLYELPFEKQLEFKSKTGREFSCVKLRVVSEDGVDIEPDGCEVGEIIVRGDSVTPGYWNDPDETRRSIKDGWLFTGDMANIDDEGYVNIVDRKNDVIITGGENVYSIEVENVIYEHPAVFEAAVIGMPDPVWGEKIKAFVALKAGQDVEGAEIIDFVKRQIAHYKAPSEVVFVGSLPKTGSGKITKVPLRKI